ncbi:hypothetical protein ACFWWT_35765 [Streptomyces sp. NPDC058676]|uniref:hypothetical protein n=1 Tax=unclassified Streptomyces TaxID=2593676 RepID=UPI003659765A
MTPVNHPVGHPVFQAGRRDIDTVIVGGRVLKHRGEVFGLDLSRARRLAEASREHIRAAVGETAWQQMHQATSHLNPSAGCPERHRQLPSHTFDSAVCRRVPEHLQLVAKLGHGPGVQSRPAAQPCLPGAARALSDAYHPLESVGGAVPHGQGQQAEMDGHGHGEGP